jgi:eukaryotic-like serine/threonine-protein kinase
MSATIPGASPTSLPPAILAQRYRLERRLAQGGMAEVWLATDLSLTRQVAVKLLKPNLAADPVVAERFRREAIAVAQLSHPNIVAVYDAIEETIGGERRQAVVMQLVNGKSLRQLLDEQKRLSPDLTMHIGACVASALDCAHRANLVHRDVKPGNILITPDGRVLLTDFGIAKGLAGTADDDLTSPNVMMGTAKYLSPEQVRGRKLDGRADLYSLGLVLYECLAGRVPFLGETDADTALARLNREATDLTRLRPTLPLGLAPLIHKLLERKPDLRYASGAEVRSELQRIAAQPKTDLDHSTDIPVQPAPTPRVTGNTPTMPTGQGAATGTPRMPPAAPRSGTTGSQPALKGGRPAGSATRPDRTPPSTVRPRQQPNRKFEQRTGPSMAFVGVLLAVAFVVGLVLWVTMGTDGGTAPLDTGGNGAAQSSAATT